MSANVTRSPDARPIGSVPQVAKEHGLSDTSLYRWLADGDVPERCYLRLGGRLHLRRRAFAAWLAGEDTPSAPTARLRAV